MTGKELLEKLSRLSEKDLEKNVRVLGWDSELIWDCQPGDQCIYLEEY